MIVVTATVLTTTVLPATVLTSTVSTATAVKATVTVSGVRMPLGRLYQAPTTVARSTPVYGYSGIKAVSATDLVITGQAVRTKKSKSPSPAVKLGPLKAGPLSATSTASPKAPSISPPRQNGTKKSPSPGVSRSSRPSGVTHKAARKAGLSVTRDGRGHRDSATSTSISTSTSIFTSASTSTSTNNNNLNNNLPAVNGNHENGKDSNHCDLDNGRREKSWSPEEAKTTSRFENDNTVEAEAGGGEEGTTPNDNEKASGVF